LIGVFDSGVGGLCAYRELRRLIPREDSVYLADIKNAPYGTKSEDELIALTRADIKRLSAFGARKILIACCTASSVWHRLEKEEREISLPIITPAARLAASLGERIAVIATEHTASSGAFSKEISKFSDASVMEFAEQELVSLVERGNRDGSVSGECKDTLSAISRRVRDAGAEVLILGCTHFSHLEGELSMLLPEVKIVSPARAGAIEMAKTINEGRRERGRVIYT